jgi:hypothetical protein
MFLTLEDPNARIHGSRDPLGVQPVWASFGRHVVTNLTTVTISIRGFTVLLLGRLLTEKMIEKGAAGERDALSIFLRAEQIGSYVRYVAHSVDSDIRGIERVKRFVEEKGPNVPIQDDASGMILSDQKVYGLWGIYSVSARTSGMIADGPVGLTEFARDFTDKNYWPVLQSAETKLFKLLKDGGKLRTHRNDTIFSAASKLLPQTFTDEEIWFYSQTLRDALHVKENPAAKRQPFFAELLKNHSDLQNDISRAEILKLAKVARGKDEVLAIRLGKIARLEALFAPAEAIFDYLQTRGDQKPADIASKIRDHWGKQVPYLSESSIDDILPEIENSVGKELAAVMKNCDLALAAGAYDEAIMGILEWNKIVMAARKAAPWIQLNDGKLEVRYRGQEKVLPDGKMLSELWRNSYFIDALKSIVHLLSGNN